MSLSAAWEAAIIVTACSEGVEQKALWSEAKFGFNATGFNLSYFIVFLAPRRWYA